MKKKILSLILCAVMLFCAVSCANPPGEGSGTRIDPGAGVSKDTTPESTAPEAEPVDFSVLTEEEQKRIRDAFLEEVKTMDSDEKVQVRIWFNNTMSTEEFDAKVEARYSENLKLYEEIYSEWQKVSAEVETLWKAEEEGTISRDEFNDKMKTASEKELKLSSQVNKLPEYNYAVNQIIDEVRRPIMEEFITEHFPNQIGEVYFAGSPMYVDYVKVTAEDIFMLLKNDLIMLVEEQTADPFGGIKQYVSTVASGSYLDNPCPVSTTELNEVYNLVDGEVAVNAGYNGTGIVNLADASALLQYVQTN